MFHRFSVLVATWMAAPAAFILATLSVVVWAAAGPVFDYSDTWQLIINTATTVLTFLAVFVLQNTQTRDTHAMQLKLDELIRSSAARNELMGIEHNEN